MSRNKKNRKRDARRRRARREELRKHRTREKGRSGGVSDAFLARSLDKVDEKIEGGGGVSNEELQKALEGVAP